jgi:quercetin dioxygenase-like cupin family protein
MKSTAAAIAMLVAALATASASPADTAQTPDLSRADLQRHDLSIPGREAVQVRVDFAPGAIAARHTHYGEEVIYVLRGTLEYDVAGKISTLSEGGVLFIPAGTVHGARNVGTTPASELATYVVEKGKPLSTSAP